MNPKIKTGRGLSGAVRYVMSSKPHQLAEFGPDGRAIIIGGQNFGFAVNDRESVELARRVMEWNATAQYQVGSATRTVEKDCLHMWLSWAKNENPGRETMDDAARSALEHLGMGKAFAIFVAHRDTEHPHVHIVASRIDPETGKAFDNFRKFPAIQGWAVRYEKQQGFHAPARQEMHDLIDAIDARDIAHILAHMTRNDPTFDARALDRALAFGITDKDERHQFKLKVLANHQVIGLREAADEPVARYTTRAVLRLENTVIEAAARMAADGGYRLRERRLAVVEKAHTLIPEQAEALRHTTRAGRLALISGEAGTGKSHTMGAIRESYEAAGYRVVGMSWTNKVTRSMDADGFNEARTVQSELGRQKVGAGAWDRETVVMVDEAAQLSTQALSNIMGWAKATGAKVILVGDAAQLGSIEKGGLFSVLAATHGVATLRQVMRTQDAEYQAAWSEMHDGQYLSALQRFDKKGDIHWSETQRASMRALTGKYAADIAADPSKKRFIFAHTNENVNTLNVLARQVAREQGKLGPDVKVQTATGVQELAVGDRVQFRENGKTQKAKQAGYLNNQTVTITGIEEKNGVAQRMTVELDVKKGAAPRTLSFKIGGNLAAGQFNALQLGYAGTVYKGQGATLDQPYVFHSEGWKSATSYVALTRGREGVSLFVSKEVVQSQGREPWMQQRGGFDALDERMARSARESFEQWKQEKPAAAATYGLKGYVSYAQEQWGKDDRAGSDLENLARMMARDEQKKAASAFIASEIVVPQEFAAAAREASLFQRTVAAVRRQFGTEEKRAEGDRKKIEPPATIKAAPMEHGRAPRSTVPPRVEAELRRQAQEQAVKSWQAQTFAAGAPQAAEQQRSNRTDLAVGPTAQPPSAEPKARSDGDVQKQTAEQSLKSWQARTLDAGAEDAAELERRRKELTNKPRQPRL